MHYVAETVIATHECTELKHASTLECVLNYLVRSRYLPPISPALSWVASRARCTFLEAEAGGAKRRACRAREATFWAGRTSCSLLPRCIKFLMHTKVCITRFKVQSCDRNGELWLVEGHVISTKYRYLLRLKVTQIHSISLH